MKSHIKKGLGFGVTSGIITTIGLMIGLYSSTNSKKAVLGGILVIAIADALSDSFGMHISEELSSKKTTNKKIWATTFSTFFFKFLVASSLIIPFIFLELKTSIIISTILAIIMLIIFNYFIAKENKKNPLHIIGEHLAIAIIVVVITYLIGKLVSKF